MSLIYPNHIQIQKPRRLIRTQRPQILEPQGSVWALDCGGGSYVDAGDNASLRITGDVTVRVRFKRNLAGYNSNIISFMGDGESPATNILYWLSLAGSSSFRDLRIGHEYGNGSNQFIIYNTNLLPYQEYDVFITRDATAKKWKLYIDGQQFGSDYNYSTNAEGGTSARLDIARNPSGAGVFFSGQIIEAFVAGRTFADKEIKELSEDKQLLLPDRRGLVGWWRLQEGSGFANGTQIKDWSGQNNHGSMQGFSSNPWVNEGVR